LPGAVQDIGGEAVIGIQYRSEPVRVLTAALPDVASALDYLLRYIASERSGISEIQHTSDVQAVGHRVVHGGEHFTESALINDCVQLGDAGTQSSRGVVSESIERQSGSVLDG